MKLDDVMKQVATPLDWAAVTLGYAAGFIVDAYSIAGGIPTVDPLTAGALGASAALGLKKALQSALKKQPSHHIRIRELIHLLEQFAGREGDLFGNHERDADQELFSLLQRLRLMESDAGVSPAAAQSLIEKAETYLYDSSTQDKANRPSPALPAPDDSQEPSSTLRPVSKKRKD